MLTSKMREAAAQLDALTLELVAATEGARRQTVRAAEAEALVARLREALRKHGEHMSSCASWDEADLMPACTCGLDAALAAWTEPT